MPTGALIMLPGESLAWFGFALTRVARGAGMRTMPRKLIIIVLLVLCSSCGRDDSDIPVGDGYYRRLVGAQSLFHIPGNGQLWHEQGGGRRMVWPYVVLRQVTTNGVVVFNGGLTDDRGWRLNPAIFVFPISNAPVEITEGVTRYYADKNGWPYERVKGVYVYDSISLTNGVVGVRGCGVSVLESPGSIPRWTRISIPIEQLMEIARATAKNGERKQYRGVTYIIQ